MSIAERYSNAKWKDSVCCNVHGFEPYFYINCPPGVGPDDISHFHQILEARMRKANRNSNVGKFVRCIEMVHRRNIKSYQQLSHNINPKVLKSVSCLRRNCYTCSDSELVEAIDRDLRKILINPNARDPFVLGGETVASSYSKVVNWTS